MKGSLRCLCVPIWVLATLVQLSSQTVYLNGEEEDICRLFKDGTLLRKPTTCNEWIICKNFTSTEGGVCEDGKDFSLSKGSCQKSLDSTDTYCSTPCSSSTQGYVGTTTNCADWYYCEKKVQLGSGVCPSGMLFDKTSTTCLHAKDSDCVEEYELCDIVPTGTAFLDEDNCNQYYTCTKYKLVPNTCDDGLYFDVAAGKCVDKKLVTCGKHPIPSDICGTKKLAVRNKFVADGATCRGYYYCRDLGSGVPDTEPTWLQCSSDRFFNEDRQGCVPRESQKCSASRCDGREDGELEVSEVEGCQHYITCLDGKESPSVACGSDKYFNVASQSCSTQVTSYGACTNTST
ncbi:peritrophin-48 [Drosophila tropicalis]|uniref:peritrophin-48 n=1 Tax=Drosophila tropicalis TaxID=46794 RepID=UPI0035AB70CD